MATLLLADDSLTIQRVIELTFADEGVRVISVSDGESAIARMSADRPDIVLADVGMPNGDGYQVAAHVKATPALAHVPVLLLTGAFEPIDESRARQAGCDGVLAKPFEPRQLIAMVHSLLDGARMPEGQPDGRQSGDERTAAREAIEPVVATRPLEDADAAASAAPAADQAADASVPADQPVGVPEASAIPAEEIAPAPATGSLASVFSALLAAERGHPEGRLPRAATPALSEAAIELVVERVVKRMTGELIRKTVLETAERLIREELDRSKLQA